MMGLCAISYYFGRAAALLCEPSAPPAGRTAHP